VTETLYDRWLALRDRLLANPKFQRAATAFPLTRSIARGQSKALFDVCAGFAYSQVLLACVRLKLLEMVAATPLTLDEIAKRTDLPETGAKTLTGAAISLGLLQERSGGRIGLGMKGAAMMGNPWIAKFVSHHEMFYADIADPLALLRGELRASALRDYWAYARSDRPEALGETRTADYTELMGASQAAVAAEILDGYDFRQHRCVLDVGGGDGSFIAAAAARHPHLDFIHFDLPSVAGKARANFDSRGLSKRVRSAEGSFHTDSLPQGADAVTLIRIAHDHNDDRVLALLKAIRAALPPDGRLIIAEPLSGNTSTASVTDAYFNMYFMAMGQGSTRCAAELSALAQAAGFVSARTARTRNPLTTGLVIAAC
jgi:demethylspheroidene O-methyltransferase